MLWSAGLEAPRHVWAHGWLLAAGGERMSKSRGNFLDPADFVAAFGTDGARYVALREVPFDRDAEVRGTLRAALQRRPRQRLRQPRQPHRVDGGPLPRRRAAGTRGRTATLRSGGVAGGAGAYGERSTLPAPRGAGGALGVRRRRQPVRGRRQPWNLAKAAKAGDEAAAERLAAVLGDLVEACRLSRSRPRRSCRARRRGCRRSWATRTPTATTATAARRCSTSCGGARTPAGGRLGAPEPLFPRLEAETEAEAT